MAVILESFMLDERRFRFDLLDGLRGIAAIVVVIFHFTQNSRLDWLMGAWVAVDLFFILSGFVIAYSYGAKILDGMTFRQFLLIRLVRLGPLYFAGLWVGLTVAFFTMRAGDLGSISPMQLSTAALLGAAWLPYLNHLSWSWEFGNGAINGSIFPLNDPAWSLFFEMFINCIFFFYVYKFRKLVSISLLGVSIAAYLVVVIIYHQLNPGWDADSFIFGFPRVMAEFFGGVLIYHSGLHQKVPRPRFAILVGVAVMALIFIVDQKQKTTRFNSIALIPLLLVLASAIKIESRPWQWVCKVLGDISYPLYITHIPMYRLFLQIPILRTLSPMGQTAVMICLCILVALFLASIDKRLRKILMARIFIENKFSRGQMQKTLPDRSNDGNITV